MAEADEEVLVKIDESAAPDAAPLKDPAVNDLVTQYKELEAQAERNRLAKEEAQKRAADSAADAERARNEAAGARAEVNKSNLETINAALTTANSEIERAQQDLQRAGEAGDYAAHSEASVRLTKATALALRYDEAKADLEVRKDQPVRQSQPIDPVEAYVRGRPAPTAAWLREHPEFITDRRKNAKLTSAHFDAVGEGINPDTPEYFEHVEKFIGLKAKPVTEGDDVTRPGAEKPKAVRPVAPVGGSMGMNGSSSSNEVRLSRSEAAAATDGTHVWNYDDPSGQKRFKKGDVIGVQEFARRKQKLQQQGAYDRSYETQ